MSTVMPPDGGSGGTLPLSPKDDSPRVPFSVEEKLSAPQRQILQYFIGQPQHYIEQGSLSLPNLTPKELTRELTFLIEVGLLYVEDIPVEPTEAEKAEARALSRGKNTRQYFGAIQVRYQKVLVLPGELAQSLGPLFVEWEQSLGGAVAQAVSRQSLAHLLSRLDPDVMAARARDLGLFGLVGEGTASKGKPTLTVEGLARLLSDAYHQRQILAEVDKDSRKLFERVKKAGGRVEIPTLLREYGGLNKLGQALIPLKERLLAWESFEGGQGIVFIPPEIARPQSDTTPPPVALEKANAPVSVTPYPPYALAWDVLTFLSYLSQNRVELTNQGSIPVREQKKILAQLWVGVEPKEKNSEKEGAALARYMALVELCRWLDLFESSLEESSRLVAGAGLSGWLSLDLYEQARRLSQCWLRGGAMLVDEVVEYPYSEYYFDLDKLMERGNRAMLSWLAWGEAGEWYSFKSLLEKVRQEDPYFIISKQELIKMVGQPGLSAHARQWGRVEGVIIQETYQTFLEWLGLVKLGRDEQGQVIAFSPTELGVELAWAVGGSGKGKGAAAKATIPAVDRPILVQPNFEIMVFVPQVATLWQLMKFANLRKLDQVSLYYLSRDSVLRGLENGLSLEEMLVWLESQSAQPLPQNLAVSVKDWSKAYKQVGVETMTVLEVADPAVLDELLANKLFAASIVRRLSPTAAIVTLPDTAENRRTNPLKTFKSRLKSGGYFPR